MQDIKTDIDRLLEDHYKTLQKVCSRTEDVLVCINEICNDLASHEPELELYVRKKLYSFHRKALAKKNGEEYHEVKQISHMSEMHELRVIQNKLFLDDRPVLGLMSYKLVSSTKDLEGGLAELTMRICVEAKPG